jgi:LmbE family N-acetylglucosaminyl deacetylase
MDPTQVYYVDFGMINHSDHRVAGQVALDCVYPLARDRLAFPELEKEGYEPHKVKTVLMSNFTNRNQYIDITDTIDLKIKALEAHASQINDIDSVSERMRQWAEVSGKECGVKYADGFLRLELPF